MIHLIIMRESLATGKDVYRLLCEDNTNVAKQFTSLEEAHKAKSEIEHQGRFVCYQIVIVEDEE